MIKYIQFFFVIELNLGYLGFQLALEGEYSYIINLRDENVRKTAQL